MRIAIEYSNSDISPPVPYGFSLSKFKAGNVGLAGYLPSLANIIFASSTLVTMTMVWPPNISRNTGPNVRSKSPIASVKRSESYGPRKKKNKHYTFDMQKKTNYLPIFGINKCVWPNRGHLLGSGTEQNDLNRLQVMLSLSNKT